MSGTQVQEEAVIPGSRAMAEMRKAFGPHIFLPDGSLNRLKMGEIVFNDEEKRQKLNSIIHPFIWHRTREELIRAQEEGFPVVVLDMPLLLEISWQLRVEEVWLVEVPLEVQIARVISRDGFTREQVMERIGKQMPTTNKMNYADVIIDNSRSVEDTRRQVREALKHVPGFQFPKGMEEV